MISILIKCTSFCAVLAIIAMTASGVLPILPNSFAEAQGPNSAPIDMETDDDDDGIPDEFMEAYTQLLSDLREIEPGEDLTDVPNSGSYKLMKAFYNRLPIADSTKAAMDTMSMFRTFDPPFS